MSFEKNIQPLIAAGYLNSQEDIEHCPKWQIKHLGDLCRRRDWIQKRLNEIQSRGLTSHYDASELAALNWIIPYSLHRMRLKA